MGALSSEGQETGAIGGENTCKKFEGRGRLRRKKN
jgi:hypothetical protein